MSLYGALGVVADTFFMWLVGWLVVTAPILNMPLPSTTSYTGDTGTGRASRTLSLARLRHRRRLGLSVEPARVGRRQGDRGQTRERTPTARP